MPPFDELINNGFATQRVVVVGDLVADQFLNGTISRVSREAPVFILKHDQTETSPGAAANAASNIAALGGRAILIGVVGDDENGRALRQKLEERNVDVGHVITDSSIRTTTKVRVLAGQHYAARQQVIRIDYENSRPLAETVGGELMRALDAEADQANAIVISDYGYGTVSAEIYEKARDICTRRQIPLVVDSRYRLSEFAGATTATPNREEVESLLSKDLTVEDCSGLRETLAYRALLVTNGNHGMLLIEDGKPPLTIDAVGAEQPVDVTGAGDTVISAYTLALACGATFADAANIANHAGGIVVMKKGTATTNATELCASLQKYPELHASQQAK